MLYWENSNNLILKHYFAKILKCWDLALKWEIGRAHVWTPVTDQSRMPSSAWKKKKKKTNTQKNQRKLCDDIHRNTH